MQGIGVVLIDMRFKWIKNELKIDTPIIAMSANLSEIEKDKCIKMGMIKYFTNMRWHLKNKVLV